jgi:predicted homoserine dehydrogenase-like protein
MIKQALDRRAAEQKPIQVGFVGAGRMGTGAISQIGLMKGIRTAVIADVQTERVVRAFELCGHRREDVVVTDRVSVAADAIRAHRPVATQDADMLTDLDIDAIVESTGSPEVGAKVALRAILARKHIIMLNVETDVVVGPILHRMAQAAGVVYTVSSGDEPGLIAEYFDRYAALGFEIVAVGKAPSSIGLFDRYATPDSVAEDARRLGVNPHFLVTFRDATKTMIEMACISNYTGLVPDIRGMHGPVAGVNEVPKLFRPKSEGGLLNRKGVVYTDHKQIQEDLKYLDVTGSDGYYNMYTPYHLVTNEIPLSIVSAVEFGHPTIVPKLGLVTEVFGAAKRQLKAGEVIDGAGGSTVYALNDLYTTAQAENVVPLGLLTGAKLLRDVPTDAAITYDMVEILTGSTLYHLRAMQDSGAAGSFGRGVQPAPERPQVTRLAS